MPSRSEGGAVVRCRKCKTEYRYYGTGNCPDCGARIHEELRDISGNDQHMREAQ